LNDYVALKVFALDILGAEESGILDRIKKGNQQHLGSKRVRTKIGKLIIPENVAFKHLALLQPPLGESLLDIQNRSFGKRLDKISIQSTIYQMLALDYLYTERKIIHTGMT
jgi:hypothetical protein